MTENEKFIEYNEWRKKNFLLCDLWERLSLEVAPCVPVIEGAEDLPTLILERMNEYKKHLESQEDNTKKYIGGINGDTTNIGIYI